MQIKSEIIKEQQPSEKEIIEFYYNDKFKN